MSFKEWNPEEVVRSMELETRLEDEGEGPDFSATAERILKENVPFAAQVMAHLGLYSENERIRLDAAKEVLNRVLGKDPVTDEKSDPLRELLDRFGDEAEQYANTGSMQEGD